MKGWGIMIFETEQERALHLAMLDKRGVCYDDTEHLLQEEYQTRGWHSSLGDGVRHTVRESLEYAAALLDGGRAADCARARDIIARAVALQDTDPHSNTYGLWPYFPEEDLSEMTDPDWNWADFCAKFLLQALIDHRETLGTELAHKAEQACQMACACIMRRNMELHYTNVVVMDCYVTIVTGQLTNHAELLAYGRKKLHELLCFTVAMGGFYEYNSPTYSMVAADDMALLVRHAQDEQTKADAVALNRLLWDMISYHYHPQLAVWTGPNARRYRDFPTEDERTRLAMAAFGKLPQEAGCMTFRTRLSCGTAFQDRFTTLHPGFFRHRNMRGFTYPFYAFPQVVSQFIAPNYTVGSFNRSEFWDQIRPLIGYCGTKDALICFRMQFLHDFYDFSSANIHCVQEQDVVLGQCNITSDRGDRHVCLDTITNGQLEASDLRIRFSLSGAISDIQAEPSDHAITFHCNGIRICLAFCHAAFAQEQIQYTVSQTDDRISFDVVLYHGPKTVFRYADIPDAVAAFTLNIGPQAQPVAAKSEWIDDCLHTECTAYGRRLAVTCKRGIVPFVQNHSASQQWVDGVLLEEIADAP